MANRHMGTARSHNRVYRRRGGGKRTLTADRIADLEHAIHNRGPLVNPEAQKAHGKLREEMAKLAEAHAEELGNFAHQLKAARTEINTLRADLYKEQQARLRREAEQRQYIADGDASLFATLTGFLHRGWRDRLRWIFLGK